MLTYSVAVLGARRKLLLTALWERQGVGGGGGVQVIGDRGH